MYYIMLIALAVCIVWGVSRLSDVLIVQAQLAANEAARFHRAFGDVPTESWIPKWSRIREGSPLVDVVQPECVDDVVALERSLYLEGLDIIEHGG